LEEAESALGDLLDDVNDLKPFLNKGRIGNNNSRDSL